MRSRVVAALLHEPTTTFAVVSTTEAAPLHEAEFLLAELAKRKLHRGALVLNRVLPPELADPGALALARRIDAQGAPTSAGTPTERRVIEAMARTHVRFAALADQEGVARRRLESVTDVLVAVPEQSGDITDLGSLAHLGDLLWPR